MYQQTLSRAARLRTATASLFEENNLQEFDDLTMASADLWVFNLVTDIAMFTDVLNIQAIIYHVRLCGGKRCRTMY
jgi:hypothetical protein